MLVQEAVGQWLQACVTALPRLHRPLVVTEGRTPVLDRWGFVPSPLLRCLRNPRFVQLPDLSCHV
jgi:hypothetical protein